MIYELSDINKEIKSNRRLFIEECEREYRRKIDSAASMIADNRVRSPLVLLSGPSASGKTTTAKNIQIALDKMGIKSKTVSFDNYYKTVDENYPRTETGELDFESPDCLDIDLLNEHYDLLSKNRPIKVPRYDFEKSSRSETEYEILDPDGGVIIFEGIHALNEMISGSHPEAFTMFVCVTSSVSCGEHGEFSSRDIRLMRRAIRDRKYRGASAGYTLYLWQNVIDGEKRYIDPFRKRAKAEIDSFLPYEICALKTYAGPMLRAIPYGSDMDEERLKILSLLKYVDGIMPKYVPEGSLIREFIGGGVYS